MKFDMLLQYVITITLICYYNTNMKYQETVDDKQIPAVRISNWKNKIP